MIDQERIRIAGFGGQGVMLLGQILAFAGNDSDLRTLWYPSYGPETRGGTANCSVTIAKEDIKSPVFSKANCLIAMNKPSLEKFYSKVEEDGNIIYNSSLIKDFDKDLSANVYEVPANDLAKTLDNPMVANMIILGSYLEVSKLFDDDTIIRVLEKLLSKDKSNLIAINKKALKLGRNYILDNY